MILFNFLLVFIVSFFQYYPARSRPILFMIPIVFFIICSFVDYLSIIFSHYKKYISLFLVLVIISIEVIPSVNYLVSPEDRYDTKDALNYISNKKTSDQQIAVGYFSQIQYQYYSHRYDLNSVEIIMNLPQENDLGLIINNICENQLFHPTWFFFAHRLYESNELINSLSMVVPLMDSRESKGSGVYLFDLSNPDYCN